MHAQARSTIVRRAATALGLAAVLALASAGVAWAHVTVHPGSAEKGSYAALTFRVPNEMDNADTTELDVQLLQNPKAPIPSVSVKPVPGWKATVTTKHLATPVKTHDGEITDVASVIKWTGGSIKPGQFQEFEISADPLPSNVDQLIFPAVQFYSNGKTVRWVELPNPGGPEPAHPAPVLKLTAPGSSTATTTPATSGTTAAASGTTAAGGGAAAPATPNAPTVQAAPASSSSSTGLAVTGIVLGAIGVLLGGAAVVLLLRKRTS